MENYIFFSGVVGRAINSSLLILGSQVVLIFSKHLKIAPELFFSQGPV